MSLWLGTKNWDLINQENLRKIHNQPLKIIEEGGIKFHSDKALEILKKNGAKIEGKIAKIPKELIQESIEKAPSS